MKTTELRIGNFYLYFDQCCFVHSDNLKYVHQLQNLYHALTEEEL